MCSYIILRAKNDLLDKIYNRIIYDIGKEGSNKGCSPAFKTLLKIQ